jgi:FkbM family methyltransferase
MAEIIYSPLSAPRKAAALARAAAITTNPAAFVANEVATQARRRAPEAGSRDNARSYRIRGFDCEISLRHGTRDVPLFYDVMVQHHYEPPYGVVREAPPGGVRVLDLGANIGLFSAFMASRVPVASVVSYEPDPDNLDLLRSNLSRCGRIGEWRIVEACAGASDGTVSFITGDFGESRVVDDADAAATTTLPRVDVFPDLAETDWLKLDIEGSEWDIIGDARFAGTPVRALAMEYHPWGCPGGEPRSTAAEMLRDAGFEVWEAREHVEGFGEIWAWRPPPRRRALAA